MATHLQRRNLIPVLMCVIAFGTGFYIVTRVFQAMERLREHDRQPRSPSTLELEIGDMISKFWSSVVPLIEDYVLILQAYIADSKVLSEECRQDMINWSEALLLTPPPHWAISMLDAIGKPPSALQLGNMNWIGSFRQCLNVISATYGEEFDTSSQFRGQYCRVTVGNADDKTANGLHDQAASPIHGMTVGLCVPSGCKGSDVHAFFGEAIQSSRPDKIMLYPTWCSDDLKQPLDAAAKLTLCIFCFIGVLVFFGTCYDLFISENISIVHASKGVNVTAGDKSHTAVKMHAIVDGRKYQHDVDSEFSAEDREDVHTSTRLPSALPSRTTRRKLTEVLLAFSLHKNYKGLIRDGDPRENEMQVMHGIRFICIVSVVYLHHLYSSASMISNPLTVVNEISKQLKAQLVLNGSVTVDTFFMLSGTLLSTHLIRELRRVKEARNVNWSKCIFYRIWRIAPVYVLVLLAYTTLFPYSGDGPLLEISAIYSSCKTSWWYNLLFVNNFLRLNGQCMVQSWYLACDMQLFMISPIFVILLHRSGALGTLVILLTTLASSMYVGIQTYIHDYPVSFADMGDYEEDPAGLVDWMNHLYFKPWCRIGPYLIGILLGYVLADRQLLLRTNIDWKYIWLTWSFTVVTYISILFGLYDVTHTGQRLSKLENAFYAGGHGVAWASVTAWIIFACTAGYGGKLNEMLCWRMFCPLCRVSYVWFLTHTFVSDLFSLNMESVVAVQTSLMAYLTISNWIVTFAVAVVLKLMLEMPILQLRKVLMNA